MKYEHDVVSVIVPIYNMEKHLIRCVKSMQSQTYQWLDIILIDDGSTDRSAEIIDQIAASDPRIRVFHKSNGGVSSARNLGLENMLGNYCTFIDPDDYVSDIYIEFLYSAITNTKAELSLCNASSVQDGTNFIDSKFPEHPSLDLIYLTDYSLWHEASRATCWGVLYKKELINDIRFDTDLFVGEDVLFFMKYLVKCNKIAFIHEPLYFYVQYLQSATKGNYTPKRWTEIIAWQRILTFNFKQPKLLKDSIEAWYVMTCAKILTLLNHSKYKDPAKKKYLIHEIRKNLHAIWSIPNYKKQKKMRLLAYALCPSVIGSIQWKYYKKKKLVS